MQEDFATAAERSSEEVGARRLAVRAVAFSHPLASRHDTRRVSLTRSATCCWAACRSRSRLMPSESYRGTFLIVNLVISTASINLVWAHCVHMFLNIIFVKLTYVLSLIVPVR